MKGAIIGTSRHIYDFVQTLLSVCRSQTNAVNINVRLLDN